MCTRTQTLKMPVQRLDDLLTIEPPFVAQAQRPVTF
eukprot:CAMPEP_0172853434 /NCGR_PEP_ID=MMETSP1075-20121228/57140_1 /TAXON_ID=2916 /ORGANISM="Ceratium fusus, Strain PA161109" /LENGTH=35 /DNA_ID= /DNA_START= /DNA_END= /DNA_ORIENTATION=